ncbi:HAMP domain-containing histidine kinase [Schleiferiaceae bacterium]|nr:HAMP domain-containing histidine kinase [Schleiferiaceae bacterium]
MMMILLVAFVLTGTFSLYHFKAENKNYQYERLERKEKAIASHIDYITKANQGQGLSPTQWKIVLGDRMDEIGSIHKLDLGLYHPNGLLLARSHVFEASDDLFPTWIDIKTLTRAPESASSIEAIEGYLIGTDKITGPNDAIELIIRVPYAMDDSVIPEEDYQFLRQLGNIYVLLLFVGIALALILSNYISRNMSIVGEKLKKVRLNQSNEKLSWRYNDEIGQLIQEYNLMVEKLEKTAVDLAKSERESAWKEMAQQVAHEIKNPLTPMKLTLQMMQREKDLDELQEMSKHLLEEIEGLTSIAEAFARFAEMPSLRLETHDVSYLSNRAVALYSDWGIQFLSDGPVYANVDKEQWSRIIHNLVKNALQSIPEGRIPEIEVRVRKTLGKGIITVSDNGTGVSDEMKDHIFEPNFTTKSSGMGLGLAMVRNLIQNFGGTISFENQEKGASFTITIPTQ